MPDVDRSFLERLEAKARTRGPGGGGTDGTGMFEQRVAALEVDVREIKGILVRIEKRLDSIEAKMERFDERLRRVEFDVAEMNGRVAQLPTAWQMMTAGGGFVPATFGFVFALLRFGLQTP